MKYIDVKEKVEGFKKGTIRTITYSKSLKTLKGVSDVVTKTTTMQVRTGVNYNNLKAVKAGRMEGTIPVENQGLSPALEWVDNNFIRNKKTGTIMLRVAFANGNKTKTTYYKNGKVVDKSEIIPLCLKSETASRDSIPTVFNISVEKIDKIK